MLAALQRFPQGERGQTYSAPDGRMLCNVQEVRPKQREWARPRRLPPPLLADICGQMDGGVALNELEDKLT